jgi:hypothetical protein
MPKLATLELKAKSGNSYVFEVYSMETEFEKTGGVYCVSKRTLSIADNRFVHDIFYIGQTDDFSNRFKDHHKKECFKRNEANCISILKVTTEEERAEIEKDLIKAYNPTCNEKLT